MFVMARRTARTHDNWQRRFMRAGALVDRLSRPFMTIELDAEHGLPDGPVLMAANHRSLSDVFVAWIGCYRLGRPTRFIVGRVFFSNPVLGPVLRAIGCIEGGKRSGADLIAIESIDEGTTCAIMPEGAIMTMEPGRILAPLLPGVATIWDKTRCPFVAVAITGAGDVWPSGRKLPHIALRKSRRPTVHVRVAAPVLPGYETVSLDRVAEIMETNCELSAIARNALLRRV
jgi:1-acyl-sn-glycerol-3-phosphate acyltransferase